MSVASPGRGTWSTFETITLGKLGQKASFKHFQLSRRSYFGEIPYIRKQWPKIWKSSANASSKMPLKLACPSLERYWSQQASIRFSMERHCTQHCSVGSVSLVSLRKSPSTACREVKLKVQQRWLFHLTNRNCFKIVQRKCFQPGMPCKTVSRLCYSLRKSHNNPKTESSLDNW